MIQSPIGVISPIAPLRYVFRRQFSLNRLVLSKNNDPYINLAIENTLFRDIAFSGNSLFLWVNSPSVIIGRYQNPWLECSLPYIRRSGIRLARRQSGGGAVYHDEGNLNFSFISEKENYDRDRNLEIVVKALGRTGITSAINERHDVIVEGKKVSGSAFRISRGRVLHHGTLLVSAELASLKASLSGPSLEDLDSKGIRSVRSSVVNLNRCNPDLTVDKLKTALSESFEAQYGGSEAEYTDDSCISEDDFYMQMKDPEWIYGNTPVFSFAYTAGAGDEAENYRFLIKKGCVSEILPSDSSRLNHYSELLELLGKPLYSLAY